MQYGAFKLPLGTNTLCFHPWAAAENTVLLNTLPHGEHRAIVVGA